jgi:hypothetical protein
MTQLEPREYCGICMRKGVDYCSRRCDFASTAKGSKCTPCFKVRRTCRPAIKEDSEPRRFTQKESEAWEALPKPTAECGHCTAYQAKCDIHSVGKGYRCTPCTRLFKRCLPSTEEDQEKRKRRNRYGSERIKKKRKRLADSRCGPTTTTRYSSPAPDDCSQVHQGELRANSLLKERLYCICHKPQKNKWMICCDGGCDNWFHGSCIGMSQADGDLADKFFCPNCEAAGRGRTSWRSMTPLPLVSDSPQADRALQCANKTD